jgi:hypothetical protein
MVKLPLRRDGMAGVCGVCGDMGLPGEEAVETEVPWTIGGTLDNWRLDELDDRCRSNDDDRESDKAVFDSRMPRYLDRAAVVLRIVASREAESACEKLFKSFFDSRSLIKSCRFLSSSDCSIEPELARPDSLMTSESGRAEDEALCFPLLFWSSSPLLPVEEKRVRRWLKLLL